jgi:hypothetical protein
VTVFSAYAEQIPYADAVEYRVTPSGDDAVSVSIRCVMLGVCSRRNEKPCALQGPDEPRTAGPVRPFVDFGSREQDRQHHRRKCERPVPTVCRRNDERRGQHDECAGECRIPDARLAATFGRDVVIEKLRRYLFPDCSEPRSKLVHEPVEHAGE